MAKVLVVDDEKSIRITLREFLRNEGHEVHTAEDANKAIIMLDSEDFDVVVTDIILPRVTGVKLMETIRSASPDVQVIMITGEPTVDTASVAVRAGAFDYLPKPITKEMIVKCVANAAKVKNLLDVRHILEDDNRRYRENLEEMVKERTDKLRESELRYRTLFENSPVSFWEEDFSAVKAYIDSLREKGIYDFRTYFNENPEALRHCSTLVKILDVNQATLRLYKAKTKEELYKGLSSVVTPKSLEVFKEEIIELSEGKTTFNSEQEGRTLKDDLVHNEVFLSIVPGYEETWARVSLSDIDITERKRAEEEHTRLATAINQADELIVIMNSQGIIQYVNPAFQKISGFSSEEAVGKDARILESGKHPDSFYNDMWNAIEQGEVWKGRVVNKKKEGTFYTADLTISPVRDNTGKIINFVSVSRDVSQEVEMEKKLVQTQKMEAIGTLAGGIAHDFNNILCVITGYSQLGLQFFPDDEKLQKYFCVINDAGNRATDLVNQILAFSRKSETNLETLMVEPLIKEAIKFLRASLPTTIEISQNIQPDCGEIIADHTQIHQIIMNLCTNAGYAMKEEGGVLTIRLSDIEINQTNLPKPNMNIGDYVQLTVEDTGGGIPKETLERIFDPFYTTKPVGEGTGMGLSVVHGIVENYDGTITVESKTGEGSKFEVFFPVVKEDKISSEPETAVTLKGNENLLFVDDEEMLVQMEKEMADSLGYNVTVANSGWQALEIFESQTGKFDLVITDQTMPGMTGVELAREIWETTPKMPIILTTGFSHTVDEKQAMDLGFSDFFKKPLDRKILGKTIRKVLDRNK